MSVSQPLTTQAPSKVLCYYHNSTQKIQIVRLVGNDTHGLEKIVFPQQRILFEAEPEELLEVHLEQNGKSVLEEVFLCQHLEA